MFTSRHIIGGTLDLLICDSELQLDDLAVIDIGVSDHHLLTCPINISVAASTFVTKIARNWHCFDVNAFRTGVVGSIGATSVNSWNDIPLDDLVEYYDSIITSLLDRLAPRRTETFRIRPWNVWFVDDCKAAKRLSRMKEKKSLKTKLPSDWKDWTKQLHDYHKLCASKSSLFWKCQMETGSFQPKENVACHQHRSWPNWASSIV